VTAIIEFNDLEFSLFRGQKCLYHSPAFAIVRDEALLFGEPALRLARIHPQQANQQYLARMNADPLPHPIRTAANHADLVYLHLKELAELSQEDALLAVPGTMDGDQLGVLLGICQEVGIAVSGFVNAAVAAVSTTRIPERIVYLDVFLQHIQISQLSANTEIKHDHSVEVKDCGFSSLLDGWVNLIADRFIQETRFDPLHTAETEQQLYNQVYDWVVGAHHQSEVSVEIEQGGQFRRVEVPKSHLEQKAQQRIDRLIDAIPSGGKLILTARAARMPGLTQRLKAAGFDIEMLAADAVAAGCNENLDHLRTADSELRLINRLPHDREVTRSPQKQALAPTHLLREFRALPVESERLAVRLRRDESGVWMCADQEATLNGDSVKADQLLRLGDVISRWTETFTAIHLEG